jgi:hypothetical protein
LLGGALPCRDHTRLRRRLTARWSSPADVRRPRPRGCADVRGLVSVAGCGRTRRPELMPVVGLGECLLVTRSVYWRCRVWVERILRVQPRRSATRRVDHAALASIAVAAVTRPRPALPPLRDRRQQPVEPPGRDSAIDQGSGHATAIRPTRVAPVSEARARAPETDDPTGGRFGAHDVTRSARQPAVISDRVSASDVSPRTAGISRWRVAPGQQRHGDAPANPQTATGSWPGVLPSCRTTGYSITTMNINWTRFAVRTASALVSGSRDVESSRTGQ